MLDRLQHTSNLLSTGYARLCKTLHTSETHCTRLCRATACLLNLASHEPAILKPLAEQSRVLTLLKRIASCAAPDERTHRTALLLGLMARDEGLALEVRAQEQALLAQNAEDEAQRAAVQGLQEGGDGDGEAADREAELEVHETGSGTLEAVDAKFGTGDGAADA